MRVSVVDPSAYTWHYDHALCEALAAAGARVELATSRFAYGELPAPSGYVLNECFYRHARGAAGSPLRRATKLLEHVPDMLRFRRHAQATADVVHFQWLDVQYVDGFLLPDRPLVLTAHDLLPRESRPGQTRAQLHLLRRVDALITHSEYGRRQLVERFGLPEAKVHVAPLGAYAHTVTPAHPIALPPELADIDPDTPVILFFGLLRPYKGLSTLLQAWRGVIGAQLWIVGRPMMDVAPLKARAPSSVRFVDRFVPEGQIAAFFDRADAVVLPYVNTERFDASGVLGTALAFGDPLVVSDIGGFSEVAATGAAQLVAPEDPAALTEALQAVIDDPARRATMSAAARAAAAGPFSWEEAARRTLAVYERIAPVT
jgi:glycosyltransferase involved in cell wall biosynthesis